MSHVKRILILILSFSIQASAQQFMGLDLQKWLQKKIVGIQIFQLQKGFPKTRRVLIIGLDGTRGDEFHRVAFQDQTSSLVLETMLKGIYSLCPNEEASSCARAQETPALDQNYKWMTSPGWLSVATGVRGSKHLVADNGFSAQKKYVNVVQNFPSFFKILRQNGYFTAAAGVGAFLTASYGSGAVSGILDYECGINGSGPILTPQADASCNLNQRKTFDGKDAERDLKLTQWLLESVDQNSLSVIMGVYDRIDEKGHYTGFKNSKSYRNQISETILLIEKVLLKIQARAQVNNEEWLVVMTSDHGGHNYFLGGGHSKASYEDSNIPFVLMNVNSDITWKPLKMPVTQMDVFPTVMKWFGFVVDGGDGQVQGL